MSGDLWQMARNGTTLLPGEARKLATAYDRLRQERDDLREMVNSAQWAETVAKAELERRWDDIIIAAKKIDRLQAILAALREPSEAVTKAAVLNYGSDLTDAIRAAVAAAEKEVGDAK